MIAYRRHRRPYNGSGSMANPAPLERFLADQGLTVEPDTGRAVEEWHRLWLKEWERVRALRLHDEDLPAPLWCWPP